MTIYDNPRSRSFTDLCRRSLRFNIYKHLFLNKHQATEAKFHTNPSWDVGNGNLFKCSGSHDQDGFHAHIRIWFDFCFTALQHILGHFGRGQLTYPHCSWASLLGSLPVLSAQSFASNSQLLFLNQRKRENGRRNVFMTKSPRKNVPDVGIELGTACMPSEHASDRATAPGAHIRKTPSKISCFRTKRP